MKLHNVGKGCVLAAVSLGSVLAQTQIDLSTQAKRVDFSNASSTKPSKTGTVLPATCSVGETFLKTDAVPGANLYACIAANSWAVQGGALPAYGPGSYGKVLANDEAGMQWESLGGDVSGSPDALSVNKLQGRPVAPSPPSNGQVLGWDGTQWTPRATVTVAGVQANQPWLCSSTNGTSSYSCGLSAAALSAYTAGMWLTLLVDTTNNGPATVNVDGGGIRNIRQSDGVTNPVAGQITAGRAVTITYDGSAWRLPPYSGVPLSAAANQFVTAIDSKGVASTTQPSFANLAGSVTASQMPALAGDVTTSAGSVATSLASVNSTPGQCGDSSHVCQVTTNDKGLVTQQSAVPVSGTGGISSLNGLSGGGQSFANDTNVTMTSAGTTHTLGWTGLLGLDRGGLNANLSTTGGPHQVLKQTSTNAAITVGQLAAGDISGLAASATTDATNAANITSGTLPVARLAAVPNSALANSSVTVSAGSGLSGGGAVGLGGSVTVNAALAVNSQTGPSYTVVAGDGGKFVTLSNGSAVGVTLPQATGAFGAGWYVRMRNLGSGVVTITPTTSTIDGAANVVLQTGQGLVIASDGANYQTWRGFTWQPSSAGSHQFATGISAAGVVSYAQPAAGDISGLAASATVDATNAGNIGSGTLGTARLPQFSGGDVTTAAAGSGNLTIGNGRVTNAMLAGSIATSKLANVQGADSNLLTAGTISGVGAPLCTDSVGGATTAGCTASAGGNAANYTNLSFSATPTFTAGSNTVNSWAIVLSANVTSSTLSGAAGGNILNFKICQNAMGGYSFAWPSGFGNAANIAPTASACTKQSFLWDGTAAVPLAPAMVDTGPTILRESAAPAGNPVSGFEYFWSDSTAHMPQSKDSSGNVNSPVRTAASGTANQWVDYIASTGIPHTSQPNFSNLSGAVALTQLPADFVCTAATASGTAYACSFAAPPASLVDGEYYAFKADVDNTGAVTFAPNSFGAKAVTKVQGGITTALVAGDIRAGQWVVTRYDGTRFQMQSPLGNAASGGQSDLLADTTPQLGGDMDPNGHAIGGVKYVACAGTDDTAAVAAAAGAAGTYMFPPNGTCAVSHVTITASNVTWIGQNTILKHTASENYHMLATAANLNNIRISGFTLDLNGYLVSSGGSVYANSLVGLYGKSGLIFEHNTFINSSTAQPTHKGLYYYDVGGEIRSNTFTSGISDFQIYGDGVNGKTVRVHDNTFDGVLSNAIQLKSDPNIGRTVVEHNTITNVGADTSTGECGDNSGQCGNAIDLTGMVPGNQVTVHGNTMKTLKFSCLRIATTASVIATDNNCDGFNETGFYSEFGAEGNIFANNRVTNGVTGFSNTNLSSRANGEPDLFIGNTIYNMRGEGFHVENASLIGNKVSKAAWCAGIGSGGTGYGNIIQGNSCDATGVVWGVDKDLSIGTNQIGINNVQNPVNAALPAAVPMSNVWGSPALTVTGATNNAGTLQLTTTAAATSGATYLLSWFYGMTAANGLLCRASASSTTFNCTGVATPAGTFAANPAANVYAQARLIYSSGTTLAYSLPAVVLNKDATDAGNIKAGTLDAARIPILNQNTSGTAAALSTTLTEAREPAHDGDVTNAAGDLTLALASQYKIRPCEVHVGGTGASNVLQSGDDSIAAAVCANRYGATLNVSAVTCWVDSGAAVTITPVITGGSGILSGALTCGVGYANRTSADGASGRPSISDATQAANEAFGLGMGGTLTSSHDLHVVFTRGL